MHTGARATSWARYLITDGKAVSVVLGEPAQASNVLPRVCLHRAAGTERVYSILLLAQDFRVG